MFVKPKVLQRHFNREAGLVARPRLLQTLFRLVPDALRNWRTPHLTLLNGPLPRKIPGF